ncbi:MAG: molecular chaperone HtpG [Oscillospiraceae bacterium]|nr:molecular chaperone HtpG [Oscillospiraceae bacterium]
MEKKEFKAESKRLLDLMINSIYTNKEIFLRELISNASDAIDKLYFISLTDEKVGLSRSDFAINIEILKDEGILKISDNGIGMTKDELENNLGTIAKSGSLNFKENNELDENVDIIGQFGVGFYSAFMVADSVTVKSRSYNADEAYMWKSQGADGYTIEPCDKESVGTEIILEIKEDTEEGEYSKFLEQFFIQDIVKKYSDYIRYPIKMDKVISRQKEDSDELEKHIENVTLNSMIPIWRKNKAEVSDKEYNDFYRDKFYDYSEPLAHIHMKSEGAAMFNAVLYIPSKAPYDFYSKQYEKGLKLFSSGVMIMDKCADLLPDYFSFVKGVVDSEDLSLNISREILQQDRQLKIIARGIERAVKNELKKMLENDREKYEEFFKAFGLQLKYGIYQSFGQNADAVKDLLMFDSSLEGKKVTLAEYVSRMKEDQKYIYYATGANAAQIENLPQTEMLREKGFEILYFTDDVDEFAVKMMNTYSEKEFRSVSSGDIDTSDEESAEIKTMNEMNAQMLDFVKDSLGGNVAKVCVSQRLKTHPVCLTTDGDLSLEMEKVLNSMPNVSEKVKAQRVLEINASHPVFAAMAKLYENDKEKLKKYATLLYNQALLIEGMPIEDPTAFSELICELMV